MANATFIPFNNDPVDTKTDSTSYTVPSGKYAYVVATLSASMTAYGTGDVGSNIETDGSSNSAVIQLWLKEGDVLSKTETTGDATTATDTSAKQINGVAIAIVSLDVGSGAVEISRIEASASANSPSSASSHTLVVNGTVAVNWMVSEYNSIS